jgi:hypothetical protein
MASRLAVRQFAAARIVARAHCRPTSSNANAGATGCCGLGQKPAVRVAAEGLASGAGDGKAAFSGVMGKRRLPIPTNGSSDGKPIAGAKSICSPIWTALSNPLLTKKTSFARALQLAVWLTDATRAPLFAFAAAPNESESEPRAEIAAAVGVNPVLKTIAGTSMVMPCAIEGVATVAANPMKAKRLEYKPSQILAF